MSDDVHSNGLLVNNEDEYKAFVVKKHPAFKMDDPINEIHTRVGTPKEYPLQKTYQNLPDGRSDSFSR